MFEIIKPNQAHTSFVTRRTNGKLSQLAPIIFVSIFATWIFLTIFFPIRIQVIVQQNKSDFETPIEKLTKFTESFHDSSENENQFRMLDLEEDEDVEDADVEIDSEVEEPGNSGNNVVIGLVTCGRQQFYFEQTEVMLKSVMISAEINKVQIVEFHHFLEHLEDEFLFRRVFRRMGYLPDNIYDIDNSESSSVKLRLHYHSINDVKVPRKYKKQMIYHPRFRCGFVRFYFPTALPQVDSLLYMDTDTIVTGNLTKIWTQFSKMNSRQLIGVVNDMEPENLQFPENSKWAVGEIPHLTKNGFNSGLLWMNLAKMRKFGWEERYTRIYQDYSKTILDTVDQYVLNILIYFNPELALIIPCNFNFGPASCEKGFYCKAAQEKNDGIMIIHGNAFSLKQDKPFYGIYKHFKEFSFSRNLFTIQRIRENLMTPIKDWYSESNLMNVVEAKYIGKCRGSLSNYLFPNFL